MKESSDFLTTSTVDYTDKALATLRSARRHGKHSSYIFFAIDATDEAISRLRDIFHGEDAFIHVFGPFDLGREREVFLKAFQYYNSVEMCCLAKYVGIAHVLRSTEAADVCVYADSDVLFLGDVSEAFDDMRQGAVLLTPHQLAPLCDATEHDHLLHGWINAGFLGFRREQRGVFEMIEWLINRISRRGFLAPQYGLSCDQTWVSALPILFRKQTSISEHPGLNVAYWNLMERELMDENEAILVNGVPLIFFHFSGFDKTSGARISKHSDIKVSPGSTLERVCRFYQEELSGTAWIKSAVAGLKTLPCSKAGLQERICLGEIINGISISSTNVKPGLFSKLGVRMDLLLRKIPG